MLAQRIKKARSAAGMSMKQVAAKLHVPTSTYRDWEYGRKIPADKLPGIAKALSLSIGELMDSKSELGDLKKVENLLLEALRTLRQIL